MREWGVDREEIDSVFLGGECGEVCVVVQGLGWWVEMATRVRDVDQWIAKGGGGEGGRDCRRNMS